MGKKIPLLISTLIYLSSIFALPTVGVSAISYNGLWLFDEIFNAREEVKTEVNATCTRARLTRPVCAGEIRAQKGGIYDYGIMNIMSTQFFPVSIDFTTDTLEYYYDSEDVMRNFEWRLPFKDLYATKIVIAQPITNYPGSSVGGLLENDDDPNLRILYKSTASEEGESVLELDQKATLHIEHPSFSSDYERYLIGYFVNSNGEIMDFMFDFSKCSDGLKFYAWYGDLNNIYPQFANQHYDAGYDAGHENGYTDGYSDGYDGGREDGFIDGHGSGYNEGIVTGYSGGYAEGIIDGHETGYDSGYGQGYEDGYNAGIEGGEAQGFDDGYNIGHNEGYDTGYWNGYDEGYTNGRGEGTAEGYENGYADGLTEGYLNGTDEGYDEGYSEGRDDGYTQGYINGRIESHDEGFEEGYERGRVAGLQEGYDNGYLEGYRAALAAGVNNNESNNFSSDSVGNITTETAITNTEIESDADRGEGEPLPGPASAIDSASTMMDNSINLLSSSATMNLALNIAKPTSNDASSITNNLSAKTSIKTPDTGTPTSEEKSVEFPWWLGAIIVLNISIFAWLFWPSNRKKRQK